MSPSSAAAGPRRSHRLLPILLTGLALAMSVSLLGGFAYVFSVDRSLNSSIQRGSALPPEDPDGPGGTPARPSRPSASNARNYLLIGRDASVNGVSRSDALLLLHLSGDRRRAHLISFPRDLWVPIPGRGSNKINAAYAFGGPAESIRTVEQLVGVRVDHFAEVDFAGFVGLTDRLGGVRVDNEHPSRSAGYAFPRGEVTLDGDSALAYVRERKSLPRGDLDRAERQRAVLRAILAKGMSPETVLNPRRFLTFVSGVAEHVTVDADLTPDELRRTALSLRLSPADVCSVQAPVAGFGRSADGQSIDRVDPARMAALAAALRADTMADYEPGCP